MFNTMYGLTPLEQKALNNSWAKVFAEDVFPAIDEERFACLHSDKASRPNSPVNVIVGALIIQALFGYSETRCLKTSSLIQGSRWRYIRQILRNSLLVTELCHVSAFAA